MLKKLRNLSIDWKVVIVMLLICALSTGVVGGAEKRREVQLQEKAQIEMTKKVEQQKKAEKIKKEKEEKAKLEEEKAQKEKEEQEEQARLEEEQKAKEEQEQKEKAENYSDNTSSNNTTVSNEPRYIPVINKLGTDPDSWQSIIDARANGFYHLFDDKGVALYFAHDYPYGKYYIADLKVGDKVNLGGTIMTVVHADVIPALPYMEDASDYALSYGGTVYMDTCYYSDGSYTHSVVLA